MERASEQRDAGSGRAEIRARLLAWIERLEKNDLPQTQARLRNGNGFCCLGVACEVAGWKWVPYGSISADVFDVQMPGMETEYNPDDDEEYEVEVENYQDGGELTPQAAARFGLTKAEHDECIRMNDDENKTFPEIAAWLRANVLPRYAE